MSTSKNEKKKKKHDDLGAEEDNEHGGRRKWKRVVARGCCADWQRKMSAARIDDYGG